MLHEYNLHSYQWKIANAIIFNPCIALWVDMGLGKTISTLTAIEKLQGIGEVKRVLIVAPLRVATKTWPEEIRKWSHVRNLEYTQLAGLSLKKRKVACINNRSLINIINVDLLDWLIKFFGRRWPYDMVVLDESSLFKSSSSKRFKSLARVNHMAEIKRVVELTGTPTSKGLQDLWSQIYLLDKGDRLGASFSRFQTEYFTYDEYSYKFTPRSYSESAIYKKLEDITLRLDGSDYISLPDKIHNQVTVELPAKAKKLYKKLEDEFFCEIAGQEVTVAFAAAKTNKLSQLANGAIYTGEAGSGYWDAVHDEKLKALGDIVEESMGAPILLAYAFKFDAERILEKFPGSVQLKKDMSVIDKWNNGEIPMLLVHPKSAGHGLNLQKGGNIVVWFSPTWSLELEQQLNARLYRQGQEKPVIIHRIVAAGTVDETIIESLSGKLKSQEDLLNALKR